MKKLFIIFLTLTFFVARPESKVEKKLNFTTKKQGKEIVYIGCGIYELTKRGYQKRALEEISKVYTVSKK